MVTVIPTKEELPAPAKNGVTGGSSCDNERPFQFIKDYQEVDFYRTPSCKPLPKDLFDTIDGQISKTSINGTFFLQIDALELGNNQTDDGRILLTLTDGICTVQALTNDSIPNLTLNTKIGSKLLLNDSISIQNGLLQLTHDNTQFQYGSNTYPRPRSFHRTSRGSTGSYRGSYEGRRNSRYDNDGGENNFSKRPPPKNTLMDFMTTLNITNDVENDKPKENKRQSNGNNEPFVYQQDGIDEILDSEDDPTQANYRERRNPLPPRLQRAQEERSRRNTTRYYDESNPSGNDPLANSSLSSTSYIRHVDQGAFNSYAQPINGSTLAYYPANPGPLAYNLTTSYPNHQTLIGHSYPNEQMTYCCGIPYATNSTYLPPNINGDMTTNYDQENVVGGGGEGGGQNDETNDSGMKSETSSNEHKSTPPSSNDSHINFQDGKRRDSHANPRPRWKIGDMCLARWNEDGEFYYATIVAIQPPFCTVLFVEYNNYDQVHFSDLKIIQRDQPFYPYYPPSSDVNILPGNPYFPPRTSYYSTAIDGCVMMPEAPPFPFNSAGTLYMYAATSFPPMYQSNGDSTMNSSSSPSKDSNDTSAIDSTTTSNDDHLHQQQQQQMQRDDSPSSLPPPCSIADAPLTLVTSDEFRQCSSNIGSINAKQQSTPDEEKRE